MRSTIAALAAVTLALSALPAAAQGCLSLAYVAGTQVVDDSTIVAALKNKGYVKIALQGQCNDLKRRNAFAYATSLEKLCPGDQISPLGAGQRCGVAAITPMSRDEGRALEAMR